MRKIIIAVAPVSSHAKVAGNPLSPQEVAAEVVASAKAGASFAHLHVRDREGKPTEDLGDFSLTLDLIREKADIIIEGSTGSRVRESEEFGGIAPEELSLDERCVAINDKRVEFATLNMGSVNFGDGVFINTVPNLRYWAEKMRQAKVRPELMIFDSSMIDTVELLSQEGRLEPPFLYTFSLGIKGAMAANPHNLHFLTSLLPKGSLWGAVHTEMTDLSFLAAAIGMGASMIRIGFEDSVYYAPGKVAGTNTELVAKAAEIIRRMGLEVATPAEARKMLGL